MGISEEAFAACLTAEIDEVLLEAAEERRSRRTGVSFGEPTSVTEKPLVPLTKADCLAFFRRNGYPDASSPGSLWGTYMWAADLGRAKYFPDVNFDEEGLSILNAYV